ncbi:MAG: endonuclease, partial [Ferruginibacter sp.]
VSGSFDVIPDPTTVQNYLVVRSISSALTQLPIDGVTYSIGQNIGGGNGTALGITSDGTFTDNVFPSTQYYYFIFAMNDQSCGSAPNYNQINPLTNNTTTPALAACVAPVASATNIVLTPANNSITGTFTAAGDANRYLVVISTSSALSASPINSTSYTAGQAFGGGTVVSFGTTTTFSAIGLTTATQYYVFVFAANAQCTGEPFYNTTALSETATTTNNTTGIPAGYYDAAASLTCQPLKTQIRDIISTGYVQLTYTPGVWNAYQFTDLHRNDANTADIIWDIYSDNPTGLEPYTYTYGPTTSGGNQCGNYSGEGSCYNREHSTPKSWFADAYPMYSDVNHLYPTDGYVNNTRSSYPYGEVLTNAVAPSQNGSKLGTGNNFGYTGTVFEPINEYKGDLARTSLYMATRYENEIIANNWSANGTANALFLSASDEPDPAKRKLQIYDAWYLKTIFKWMSNDPVSQKEIDRNNAIYYQSGQNNRNPYIDHPEYAAIVFQCTGLLPVTITDFVGVKNNVSVLLKWYATFETSFKQYDIERSINGTNFNKIGEVAGRNLANYSFTDDNLPGGSVAYYRLKMIDIDSRSNYSKTIAIKLNNNISNALVYPNPTRGDLNIKFLHVLSANSTLQVTDVTGRIVKQQDIAAGKLNVSLDVKQLPVGRYFIKIANSTQAINQSFIVIK